MTDQYDDLDRRALDTLESIQQTADEHSQIIIGTLALAFLGTFAGVFNPSVPAWWPLIPWMLAAAGVTAFVAGLYIYALIPDKDGILLVRLRADHPNGRGIWELYEDEFQEMTVDGQLAEWSESARRVYEVRDYDPEENHAIANWREAEPASAILDKRTPEDAIEQIAELRQVYEPEAARARRLQRRIRGIVRRLDRERTEARARQLDEATGLEAIDAPSIAEILDEELPEDIHPEAGGDDLANVDESTNGHAEPDRFELEQDEYEALLDEDEPVMRGL
jgi:hypothetical protein